MAINRLTIDGYASLELNRVSFSLTGRVVADVPLASSFNAGTPAENGMILAVNYAANEVVKPSGMDDVRVLALHCSPEKEYDPNLSGLNQFKLTAETTNKYQMRGQGFYPRLGILSVGEKFTTNCISYDTADYTNNAGALAALAAYATTPVYGTACSAGTILLDTTIPSTATIALQVCGYTTMPNGDVGVKFVVVKAQ